MAKKQLIQVVRELSVGMDTIYDHLVAKGFELEKKPNAKLTDDMYDALLVEFQSDLAIKNKAEQMSLGSKPVPKKEEKVEVISTPPREVIPPKPVEQPIIHTPEPEPPVVVETPVEEVKKEEPRHELKVVGKIDLDDLKRKKKPVEEEPAKVEEVVKEEPPVAEVKEEIVAPKVETPEPVAITDKEEAPASTESRTAGDGMDPDEMFRAKSPTLKGLKILGKIDTDRISKPVPKKKEERLAETIVRVSPAHLPILRVELLVKTLLKNKNASVNAKNFLSM